MYKDVKKSEAEKGQTKHDLTMSACANSMSVLPARPDLLATNLHENHFKSSRFFNFLFGEASQTFQSIKVCIQHKQTTRKNHAINDTE